MARDLSSFQLKISGRSNIYAHRESYKPRIYHKDCCLLWRWRVTWSNLGFAKRVWIWIVIYHNCSNSTSYDSIYYKIIILPGFWDNLPPYCSSFKYSKCLKEKWQSTPTKHRPIFLSSFLSSCFYLPTRVFLCFRKGNGVTSGSKAWHLVDKVNTSPKLKSLLLLLWLPYVNNWLSTIDRTFAILHISHQNISSQYALIDTSRFDYTGWLGTGKGSSRLKKEKVNYDK